MLFGFAHLYEMKLRIWQRRSVRQIGVFVDPAGNHRRACGGRCGGYMYRKNVQEKNIGRTEEYARNLLEDARRRAEEKKKESILEAERRVIRLRTNWIARFATAAPRFSAASAA